MLFFIKAPSGSKLSSGPWTSLWEESILCATLKYCLPPLHFFFPAMETLFGSIQPFPWESRGGIFGLIRSRSCCRCLQMLRVAAGPLRGLTLQTIQCWIFISGGFPGRQRSLGSLTEQTWHTASLVSLRIGFFFGSPIVFIAQTRGPAWANSQSVDVVCVHEPLRRHQCFIFWDTRAGSISISFYQRGVTGVYLYWGILHIFQSGDLYTWKKYVHEFKGHYGKQLGSSQGKNVPLPFI